MNELMKQHWSLNLKHKRQQTIKVYDYAVWMFSCHHRILLTYRRISVFSVYSETYYVYCYWLFNMSPLICRIMYVYPCMCLTQMELPSDYINSEWAFVYFVKLISALKANHGVVPVVMLNYVNLKEHWFILSLDWSDVLDVILKTDKDLYYNYYY